jgi:hypothetical protein
VLPLFPCTNEHSFPCFFIVNDVLSRPQLGKFAYTSFRTVEGMHCLDEMQGSVALQLEDAKGQTHPTPRGPTLLGGTAGDYHTGFDRTGRGGLKLNRN